MPMTTAQKGIVSGGKASWLAAAAQASNMLLDDVRLACGVKRSRRRQQQSGEGDKDLFHYSASRPASLRIHWP